MFSQCRTSLWFYWPLGTQLLYVGNCAKSAPLNALIRIRQAHFDWKQLMTQWTYFWPWKEDWDTNNNKAYLTLVIYFLLWKSDSLILTGGPLLMCWLHGPPWNMKFYRAAKLLIPGWRLGLLQTWVFTTQRAATTWTWPSVEWANAWYLWSHTAGGWVSHIFTCRIRHQGPAAQQTTMPGGFLGAVKHWNNDAVPPE